MRSLPSILAGIVAGGVLHIICIFSIPQLAAQDAWSRLAAAMKHNVLVIADEKNGLKLPFTPPDVMTAYCLFDLAENNVIVKSPLPERAWSLTVSTRSGENFYLITGADSKKPGVRLLILRRDRLPDEASTEKTEEGDDQNIIVSPSETGIVAIRAPLRGESFRAETAGLLRNAGCEPQKPMEPVVATADPQEDEPSQMPAAERRRQRRHRRR